MTSGPLSSGNAAMPLGHVSRPRKIAFRWTILAVLGLITMLVNADLANFGIALPSIKNEFRISNAQAGLFPLLMLSCFAAMQIPASLVCRKFGPRYMMMVALGVTAIASYEVGTSATASDVMIFRSILGIAEACFSVCCVTVINNWFSVRDRGTANGFFWGASKLGPVISPPIAVIVLQALGWRSVFQLFTLPVLLAAVLWLLLVRNHPEQSRYVSRRELEAIRNVERAPSKLSSSRAGTVPPWVDKLIRLRPIAPVDTIGGVFRSWNLMGNALATAFMVGVFFVFIAWLPSYLINGKHLALASAGILSSVMYAGAVSGNLAGGWLSDNLLGMRRKPLMMLGALFTSAALIAVIFSPADQFLLGGLLLATGFIVGLGYSHFFSYPMSLTTKETYPIAFGVLNTGAVLAAGVFPFITGVILDHGSWTLVFLFLSACALLCLIFLMTIREASTSS